jgi:hypothetical protein
MVLEVTGIGQLKFNFGSIFFSCCWCEPAVGAVEMWKSGDLGRISKPGGKSGKLALAFEFSTLSMGRHFHGAFHRVVLGAQRRRGCLHRRLSCFFLFGSFFRCGPKSEVSSQKSCARIA